MGLTTRGRTALAAGAASAVLIAGGGAYALAGQGSSTLSACVHHRGGGLYEAKRCGHRDRKLTWNQIGPQGLAGPSGARGANGTNGTNGANGTNGTNGTNATAYQVALAANGTSSDIAPMGSGDIYALCNSTGGETLTLLGVSDSAPWSIAGSYSKFQFAGTAAGTVYPGPGTPSTGTYAIARQAVGGDVTFLEDTVPATDTGIFSGSAAVTLGSGSGATTYLVNFQVQTTPGSPGGCQYMVSVSAPS